MRHARTYTHNHTTHARTHEAITYHSHPQHTRGIHTSFTDLSVSNSGAVDVPPHFTCPPRRALTSLKCRSSQHLSPCTNFTQLNKTYLLILTLLNSSQHGEVKFQAPHTYSKAKMTGRDVTVCVCVCGVCVRVWCACVRACVRACVVRVVCMCACVCACACAHVCACVYQETDHDVTMNCTDLFLLFSPLLTSLLPCLCCVRACVCVHACE